MKYYSYNTPGGERGEITEVATYSEEEILAVEWDTWSDRMERMYGPGHAFITKENCIADWVTEHWAWEDENYGDIPNEVIVNLDEDVITWGNTAVDYSTLEVQTEQWFPVLGFRWLETIDHGYSFKTLQQHYLSNTGKEKWVDVPTVIEEK